MREYVKSKEFHRRMRLLLAPKFEEMGWKPEPGSRCAFKRGVRVFWLQTSKYNNNIGGGKFTINVGARRVLSDLTRSDREVGKEFEARLIKRLPRPDPDPEIEVYGENGELKRIKLGDLIQPNPRSWDHAGSDVWLRYFVKEDLDDWAAFLAPRLNRLTASYIFEVIDPTLWIGRAKIIKKMFRSK